MRLVVTGGAGFLGRHLIRQLFRENPSWRVDVVDSVRSRPATLPAEVRFHGGTDILDQDRLSAIFTGADAVFHLAALISFKRGDRDLLYRVNRDGTRSVAAAAVAADVRKLIHVSSVAALGFSNLEDGPVGEHFQFDTALARGRHYMLSKRQGERELKTAVSHGIDVSIAYPGLMYGPEDRQCSAIFRSLQRGRLWIYPPGGTNVVDVRDVVSGLLLLLTSEDRPQRTIFSGHNIRYTELFTTMCQVIGATPTNRRAPRWSYRLCRWSTTLQERCPGARTQLTTELVDNCFCFRYFSSSRASSVLDWAPRFTLRQTLLDSARDLVKSGLLAPFEPPSAKIEVCGAGDRAARQGPV